MLLCERGELATDPAYPCVTIPTAALTELLAAAEECVDDTTKMVRGRFGKMVPYPDLAADAERALAPVRRLRAAVARVRGE